MDSCLYCGRRDYLQLRLIEQSGQKFTAAVCKYCRGVETRRNRIKFFEQIKLLTSREIPIDTAAETE